MLPWVSTRETGSRLLPENAAQRLSALLAAGSATRPWGCAPRDARTTSGRAQGVAPPHDSPQAAIEIGLWGVFGKILRQIVDHGSFLPDRSNLFPASFMDPFSHEACNASRARRPQPQPGRTESKSTLLRQSETCRPQIGNRLGLRNEQQSERWRLWLRRLRAECPRRIPLGTAYFGESELACVLLVAHRLVLRACQ